MEEQAIRKYAALMKEMDLSGLEITEEGSTLRLERTPAPAAATVAVPAPAAAPAAPAGGEAGQSDCVNICSPMIGVFYNAPAENAEPFVKVGDRVHKGDVLCIIEAMKLMNEISSDYDGVIVEVCAGNGQVVDFGHLMFRLQKEQV